MPDNIGGAFAGEDSPFAGGVAERAREVLAARCETDGELHAARSLRLHEDTPGDGTATVLKAMLAFRLEALEEAAKVADRWATDWGSGTAASSAELESYLFGGRECASGVAAAIRALASPSNDGEG